MGKKSKLWSQVEELLEKGENPQIQLHPGTAMGRAKRRPGTPRKTDPTKPKHQRYGHLPCHSPSGTMMRCRRPGCSTKLPSSQYEIVCSDECKEVLVSQCEILLYILKGKGDVRDLPSNMRSGKVLKAFSVSTPSKRAERLKKRSRKRKSDG